MRPVDQARVVPDSVQIEEEPPVAQPLPEGIYPQTLTLRFRVRDPLQGAPEVVPLFPGMLRFIADPGGTLPTPGEVSPANYQNWTTRGLLSNSAAEKTFRGTVEAAGAGLAVVPNIAWFGPVRLTSNFLFSNLGRSAQPTNSPGSALRKRISNFLRGDFTLRLKLGATRAQDDVVTQRMPVMDMAGDGWIELRITIARRQTTLDGPSELLDAIYGPPVDMARVARLPSHPLHGVIPARYVYREVARQGNLIDFGGPLATAIENDWDVDPTLLRYFPIHFRRIFAVAPESSVHFPWNAARIMPVPELPESVITELRLPTHGVVFLPLTQEQAQATTYLVSLVPSPDAGVEHELRLLLHTPESWREKAGPGPVFIDLQGATALQVRRRMKVEMLVEPAEAPRGDRCTYLTLRRSVRALINNRILGGRLNSTVSQPRNTLREHLVAVMAGATYPAGMFPVRFFDDADTLFNEQEWRQLMGNNVNRLFTSNKAQGIRPDSPAARGRRLEPFLIAFFPTPAPQEVFVDAPPADAEIWPLGKVVYHLWQTLTAEFFDDRTKRNFRNVHVGRGGAGALVASALAAGYVSAPDPFPLRAAANPADAVAHMNLLVANLLQNGEPGAICQFYSRHLDFVEIAGARQPPPDFGAEGAYGHSPVFIQSVPVDASLPEGGALMVDQFGLHIWPIASVEEPFQGHIARLIRWIDGHAERVWAAANWDE